MTEFKLAGITIETPLINAAGSINGVNSEQIINEVETLATTAIGAITVGTVTIPMRRGNEAEYGGELYYYDAETETTYNSMGLPNIGLEAARKLMPRIVSRAHERGKPIIISVSPTIDADKFGDSITQAKRLVKEMHSTGADLIELNISCPNLVTGGERKPILGYDCDNMEKLVEEIAPFADDGRLGVKLPPYLTEQDRAVVPRLAALFKKSRVFRFAVTANTVPCQFPHREDLPGGMSGPAMKWIGREQLSMWKRELGDDIEIISTLGVDNGREMAARLALGAAAVGGVTFLWQKANWGGAVTEMIDDWTQEAF